MHASRPLKAAAVTVLTSVVAAVAVAGPMAGSALAAKPVASVLPALSSDLTGAVTGQTSVTFTWTTTPPTTETFTCTLDGAASACGTGKGGSKSYGPLAAGTHNFVLRAKQSGHFRSVNASRSWTIDKAPPQAPTVQSVPSPTSNASASVSFTDADPSVDHLLCSVAENSPTSKVIQAEGTCVSPYAVVGPLGTGTYTASVVAVDAAANRSVAGTTTWTVDVTAPGSPVFTTQPANPTNATTASFAWTSDSDVVGTTCSVDGAAAKVCTSPQQLPSVSVGPHSFLVTDTDGLGNRSVGEVDWVVDLTSPVAPSVNGPSNPTDQSSALFSFADVELATTFMCSLDGATFQTCQSPVSYPSLLDGAHHFQVKAVDAAGNTSAPTPYDWTIDTTPTGPAMSPPAFIGTPAAFSNSSTPTFTWLGLDDTTTGFLCRVDSGSFAACPGPDANGNGSTTVTVTSEGLHVFAVKATDGTNFSPATSWSWTYDKTPPPAPAFSTTPATTSNSGTAVFSFASEPSAQFTCALDAAVAALCATPVTYRNLTAGSHTFHVTARDAAGNTSQSSYSWTIDVSAPAAPQLTGPTSFTKSSVADVSWTDADSTATFTCRLDAGTASTCGKAGSGSKSLAGLTEGTHAFAVTATNSSAKTATAQISWIVDTTKPVLHVSNVPADNATTTSPSVAPTVSQTETNPGNVVCSLTGSAVASTCGPYSNLQNGSYTLSVNTTDLAGNAADTVVTHWTVSIAPGAPGDITPPTASVKPTTTLLGASTATFSETVHSLTAGRAALVVTGTTTVVPTAVACLSGSNVVACTGSFTGLRLTPRSALMPGQHYTVRLLAGAVKDAVANPLVAKSVNFRGSRSEQETTAAKRMAWSTVKAKAAYGRSFVHENAAKASVAYTFTGTNVTWWTTTGANQGKAKVFIDGVRKAVVNNYAASTHYKVGRKFGRLANKRHTIRIVVRGVKGARAGTGTFVSVDAFSVGKKRTNTPSLVATWRSLAAKQFSAGHAATAATKGDALTFTFRGTGVSWVTEKSRNQGKVAVYIDGVRKAVVDNYALATKFGVKRYLSRLTDKVHTLKLVVLGTHHKGATGTWVTVDRFLVT